MAKRLTAKEFIEKAILVHGNSFSYKEKDFINMKTTKMAMYCNSCKNTIYQIPSDHIQGHGCNHCSYIKRTKGKIGRLKHTKENIIEQSKKLWGDNVWDYSKFNYKGKISKCIFICKNCEVECEQRVESHLKKMNPCPSCTPKVEWSRSAWLKFCIEKGYLYPSVYIVSLIDKNEDFIKIGMTVDTKPRFEKLPYTTNLLQEIKGKPLDIYNLEKKLHRFFKKYKYNPLKKFGGYTECFNLNILQDLNFQIFLK